MKPYGRTLFFGTTGKWQGLEMQAKATRGTAMQKTGMRNSWITWRGLGLLLLAFCPLKAQALDCDGDYNSLFSNYNDFALDNVWGQKDLVTGVVTFEAGYGPSEDKDEDGLTNLQEFNGWSAVVNGRVQWFTWNKSRCTLAQWANCGPDPENYDTDCDGVSDFYETRYTQTNPQNVDTDGDGLADPIEVYAGLNPRSAGWSAFVDGLPAPGARPTGENPLMDPDGDGMSTVEELPAFSDTITECASAEAGHFPFAALTNAFWTSPLDYDTDDDRLIDSFERKYDKKFNALVAEPDPLSFDADLDKDGLVNFREMCIHPLLANYWSTMTRSTPPTPFDTYPIPRLKITGIGVRFPQRPTDRGDGLYMPNYMNKANFDGASKQSGAFSLNAPIPPAATVQWGHPFGSGQEYLEFVSVLADGTVVWKTLKGVERWTKPDDGDTDNDGMPDGWEVEHGLNPIVNNIISGVLGDPDQDTLLNYQEYFGQDGYRVDLVTGTGDESNPWIARAMNQTARSAFASRAGQGDPLLATRGEQAPSSYAVKFTETYPPDLYPGFFNPLLTIVTNTVYDTNTATDIDVVVTNWVPIVGVPSFPDLNDVMELLDQYDQGTGNFVATDGLGAFQPFATTVEGFYYAEEAGSEDGRYTPGIDFLWYGAATFTTNPPASVLISTNAPAEATPGFPITDNIPLKYPMPGTDSDNDGWPDALEIQMDVRAGRQPTSPVQSHNPLVPRSARVISDDGLTISAFDTSRQYFAKNFTIEAWVYIEPEVGNNTFEGSFVKADYLGQFFPAPLKAFDLGVKTINGFDTVPYVEMQTLGGKTYRSSAARSLPLGQWVHLAGVFGRDQNSLTFYVNGLVEQSLQVVEEGACSVAGSHTPGGALVFAQPNTAVCSFIDRVWIDEVRIWGIPRSAQEIADNRHRLIDPVQVTDPATMLYEEENPLFAYFSFDDGGTTAEDLVRRAKCSLYGNRYPYDLTVPPNLESEYLYHDQYFSINSDEIGGSFQFDANNPAPVLGALDSVRGEFDSDRDGLPDSWEIVHQLNPFTPYTPDHNDMSARYDPAWGEMSPVIVERTGFVYRTSINAGINWLEITAPQVAVINGPEIIIQPCPNCIIAYILIDPDGEVKESNMSWYLKTGQVYYIQDGQRWYVTDEGLPVKQVTYGGGSNINWIVDTLRDPDNDGLNNQYEYWSQTNPNRSDTDEDGIIDGEEDFDGDGLPNRLEADFKSRPDLRDTDDDGWIDSSEQAQDSSPISSASPAKSLVLHLDGKLGSYLDIVDRSQFRLADWTVEARVLPTDLQSLADGQGASIVRRVVQDTVDNKLAANFELRVVRMGDGTNSYLTPEARYIYVDNATRTGTIVSVSGSPIERKGHRLPIAQFANDPYPTDGMTHLAATYSSVTAELRLYLNGAVLASQKFPDLSRPPQSGKGTRSFVRVGEHFAGFVDDIRIWSGMRSEDDIYNNMESVSVAESNLLAVYDLDDGGWPATPVKGWVIAQVMNPPAVEPNAGDRYLVKAIATGAWAGNDDAIAEWTGSFWDFTTATESMRLLNAATGDVLEWDGGAWVVAVDPTIIRSVDYAAEPTALEKMDGVSWLAGGNIVTIDSGLLKTSPAPAKVFCEGAMVKGTEAAGDFAWWNSKAEYYRYDGSVWLRWGPALHWLAPVRLKVDGVYADEASLLAAAGARIIGERFLVEAEAAIYTAMSEDGTLPENYATEPLSDNDRILLPAPDNAVKIWDGASLVTLADGSTLDGDLYVYVRNEGMAYKSDGNIWSRWGMIPSSEDGKFNEDWNSQWRHAAKISGGVSFRLLDGISASTRDTDGDGLPDDWEIANGLDPNDPTGNNGADGDPDRDHLNNLYEYLLGYDPWDDDTNNNGINDGEEDYDRDGLPNWYEQEVTRTRPDVRDTDDDGLTDYDEAIGKGAATRVSDPIWSLDPPFRRSMEFKGNGHLTIARQSRHHLQSWTVMSWVKPADDLAGDSILIRRTVQANSPQYSGPSLVNYELGLRLVQPGYFAPYVRHVGLKGGGTGGVGDETLPMESVICINTNDVNDTAGGHQATGLIVAGEWTHVAGTYDAEMHTMNLFINGELSVYRNDVFPPGGMALGTSKEVLGDLTIGGGNKAGGTVEAAFKGWMDDVKITAGATTAAQIQYEASKQISTTLQTINQAVEPEVRQLPISEALQYEHTNMFVLVRFKAGAPNTAPMDTAAALGMSVQRSFKIVPIHRLQLAAGDNLATKLAELRANPNVLYAEPDYVLRADRMPNDPLFSRQWGMYNTAVPSADISAPEAWSQTTGSDEIIVAVIDTGVDYTHPDLLDNMWVNTGEIPDNLLDDDGNGYIDDYHGWNFSTFDTLLGLPANDPMDYNGHGTHCAGIIGAVGNNSTGVAGVNWKVKIMPVSFLGFLGMGMTSDAILALEYAWQNGARISNNSWGGGAYSQALRDAIEVAGLNGHLFVASAGNDSVNNDEIPHYPSSYDLPYIVAVAATDSHDLLADFSCYGELSVDLAAPGVNILSTYPGSQYVNMDGTSMAGPFVSGAAALLLSRNSTLEPLAIKRVLMQGVDRLDALEGKVASGGRLNLARVVGGSLVLDLAFNDGGVTAEDFTTTQNWNSKLAGFPKDWYHAASRFNAFFSLATFVPIFEDTDGDGMPDWWEEAMGLNPMRSGSMHGAAGDPDNDGLTNYYEYLAGTNPFDADTDHDGINDFNADSDGDGLSNGQEQQAGTLPGSEWLGDRVDPADTDDDGIADIQEIANGTNPVKASDPDNARAMRFSGSGRLVIDTEHVEDASLPWTVEAWVKPIGSGTDGIIIRRAEQIAPGGNVWVDYELGLDTAIPYITYAFRTENNGYVTVRVDAPKALAINKWTHVAAVRDPDTLQTRLFVNGKCVAMDPRARMPATSLRGMFSTVIGEGLVGELDAVRVWSYARTGAAIQDARNVPLPEANIDGSTDKNRAPKRIFNFDDGGVTAENSFYLNDWMANWQNAANLEGDAQFVPAAWPPVDLDSDDDASSDVAERTNNTLLLRSESPYVPRALKFSGMGGVLATEQVDGMETMLYAASNWTVEAWVKPVAAPAALVPLVKRATLGGGSATFELGLNADFSIYAGFDREDAGHVPFHIDSGSKTLTAGEWVHLAATYSSDDNRLILYLNGVEQIRGTDTSARPVVNRAGRLELGGIGFIGEMKEIRVWNKTRTPAEVYANFSKTLLFSVAALENSFRCTGASGNQSYLGRVTDQIENGYDYDHTSIGAIGDEYRILNYVQGRLTHKFTLETWIRMQPGAAGGRAVTRQIDVMLKDQGSDWRITEALVVETNGVPSVEWWGQVNIATPIYEEEEIPNPDPSKTNVIKRKVLNRLEFSTELIRRKLISEVDIRDGQWHHLAAVGDSQRIRLYVDGELETEALSYYVFKARSYPDFETLYWQYSNAGSALRIGDSLLEADLDEVMFWNEDRTQAEIQNHMDYGLTAQEIKIGRGLISPLPEYAINDKEPHVDLVSYMFFDGTPPLPFVVDAANEPLNYRILPDMNGDEILRNSRPPIFVDRLRALKDDLAGYFAADDGGETAENFMKRNDLGYAGLLQGDAEFVSAPADVTQEDGDGDGLPDWWEEMHDLDAGDPDGANGAYGDPDGDLLSNVAEFLAGTDPNNWDTDGDGVSDYDSTAGGLTFGEYYMDGDQLPDAWELLYPDDLSPLVNDAHSDPDGDGWDNLAEYLGSGFDVSSTSVINTTEEGTNQATEVTMSETVTVVAPTRPNNADSYPVPQIKFTFQGDIAGSLNSTLNDGLLDDNDLVADTGPGMGLVVWAYSDPMMRKPDAKTLIPFSGAFVSGSSATVTRWTTGHVRQGPNIFMAFVDANEDGIWNEGEWLGYSYGVNGNGLDNIQWGSAEVTIGLTDKPAGYIRFSWEQDMAAIRSALSQVNGTSYRVEVYWLNEAKTIYSTLRNLESMERPYITEMDLKVGEVTPMNGSYRWTIKAESATAPFASGTNYIGYASTLATPTILAPANMTLAHAQNKLRLTLSREATQIAIQILRGPSTVLTTTVPAPFVGNSGVAEMDMPWLAGWGPFTNGDFTIRVSANNPARGSTPAASATFSVNLQPAPAGAGMIKGKMGYFGTNAGNRIVEAFVGAGFDQTPVARTLAAADGSYTLLGLRPGTYHVRGFKDKNGNAVLDPGEPWGFVKGLPNEGVTLLSRMTRKAVSKSSGDPQSPYAVEYRVKAIAVAAQGAALGQDMIAYDSLAYWKNNVDSDGDGLTDDVELALGTSPVRRDSDFDDLDDAQEVALGTNPANPDHDGDGMPDGWEYANRGCGLDPKVNNAGGDADGDGLANELEYLHGTNPCNPDTDGDGMPDGWEVFNDLNPLDSLDPDRDSDGDGLTNGEEKALGSDPNRTDSDGDGMPDGWEANNGLNPADPADATGDLDGDGLPNLGEFQNQADPNDPDTDDDGLNDGNEVLVRRTNPANPDTDFDGLLDGYNITVGPTDPRYIDWTLYGIIFVDAGPNRTFKGELSAGTDPLKWDTDGDGFNDGVEVAMGTDPKNGSDYPVANATAATTITGMEIMGTTAHVTYRVVSMNGTPAIIEFMTNTNLLNGSGWITTGVQQNHTLSDVGQEFMDIVPNPGASRILHIRIISK